MQYIEYNYVAKADCVELVEWNSLNCIYFNSSHYFKKRGILPVFLGTKICDTFSLKTYFYVLHCHTVASSSSRLI